MSSGACGVTGVADLRACLAALLERGSGLDGQLPDAVVVVLHLTWLDGLVDPQLVDREGAERCDSMRGGMVAGPAAAPSSNGIARPSGTGVCVSTGDFDTHGQSSPHGPAAGVPCSQAATYCSCPASAIRSAIRCCTSVDLVATTSAMRWRARRRPVAAGARATNRSRSTSRSSASCDTRAPRQIRLAGDTQQLRCQLRGRRHGGGRKMVGQQRPSKRIELCASLIRSNEQTCFSIRRRSRPCES
jgi:hypothetical protein